MENKEFTENNQTNKSNKAIIALLSVLIIMVTFVGGYFIIKDITKSNDDSDKNSTSQQTNDSKDKNSSGQSQSGSSDSSDDSSSTASGGSSTPTSDPTQEEIEADITYAEVRSNNYYIEAQINGQINGTCEISVIPTNGSQGHHETEEIEISNKVSICNESFSLKGMNPGEHKVTVIIDSADGRTKTIEKIVNI